MKPVRLIPLFAAILLGIVAGLVGYWIFQGKVPAAMQTSVLATEAKIYYIGSGVGLEMRGSKFFSPLGEVEWTFGTGLSYRF